MRDWNLQRGDPLSLVLAADARLCTPDYLDDQIWELRLRSGEPPALSLQTTYGLRAREMRLLLRFTENDNTRSDPEEFAAPPAVHRFFPNYLLLTFSPFEGIDVVYELWVPESQAIAGRLRVINTGVTPRAVHYDLAALLTPSETGQRMTPAKIQGVTVLQGRSGDLFPVIFLTGGPQGLSSPYPCLTQQVELLPGLEHQSLWVHAGLRDPEESFQLARATASRNWEAEAARVEMTNSSTVEVHTGDPQWDAALALGQKAALGLAHGVSEHLPYPSFVLARGCDYGYSLRGDGSDYNYLWNGQTALDTWYLAQLILPAAPELVKGFLRNFLATQTEHGYIDWKPSLAGRQSRMDATPVLATLAWEIFEKTGDRPFLEAVFPDLLTFVLGWFSPYHDRDGDGIPEWDHPRQSGFEDHPMFARWHPWAQGVDITTSESPDLCALLFRECQSLMQIARELNRSEPLKPLQAIAQNLHLAVEASWDEDQSVYRHWDRDTHQSPGGKELVRQEGTGSRRLNRRFYPPARLHVRLDTEPSATRRGRLLLKGRNTDGDKMEVEAPASEIRWYLGMGTWTSDRIFATLTRFEVHDVPPGTQVTLSSVDYGHLDQGLLLPVWAGIPGPDRAAEIAHKTILAPEVFGQAHGIPACAAPPTEAELCSAVWAPWNAMIGSGLARYGLRQEAAEVFTRLMQAMVSNLVREGAFRSHYRAAGGEGLGERNALGGLPPLGLFLDTLGVRLISPWQVALEGYNPFPWSVKVKYRGLTIIRERDTTEIIFPNGQAIKVRGSDPRLVDGRPGSQRGVRQADEPPAD